MQIEKMWDDYFFRIVRIEEEAIRKEEEEIRRNQKNKGNTGNRYIISEEEIRDSPEMGDVYSRLMGENA